MARSWEKTAGAPNCWVLYISKFYLPYAVCFSFGCLLTLAPNRSLRFSSIIIIMITTPITPNGVVFFFLPGCAMQLLSSSFGVTAKSHHHYVDPLSVSFYFFFFQEGGNMTEAEWITIIFRRSQRTFLTTREKLTDLWSPIVIFFVLSLSRSGYRGVWDVAAARPPSWWAETRREMLWAERKEDWRLPRNNKTCWMIAVLCALFF